MLVELWTCLSFIKLFVTERLLYLFAPWSKTWEPQESCPRAAWGLSSQEPAARGTATRWTRPPGRRWTGSGRSCQIPGIHCRRGHGCRWLPGPVDLGAAPAAADRTAQRRMTARGRQRCASNTAVKPPLRLPSAYCRLYSAKRYNQYFLNFLITVIQ